MQEKFFFIKYLLMPLTKYSITTKKIAVEEKKINKTAVLPMFYNNTCFVLKKEEEEKEFFFS
jgi:hypothetical protein